MKKIIDFLFHIVKNHYSIYQMTKRNVIEQYKRSKLGMFWSLAEPLAFMGILYIVFGIGLRGGRNMDIPFICYLVTGLSVINFFNQTLNKGTDSIRSHAYLLKKIDIRLGILPVVTVFTGIINHLIFLAAALVIIFLNKFFPNLYWFQVFYYLFALSAFLLGITWFTSSVGVFFPDLRSIVNVIGRMLFYFTPIFWSVDLIPDSLKIWVKLNPLYYITVGYRDSFFYNIPFWEHPFQTLYFWLFTILMIVVGSITFRKLRPQFADFI